MERIALVCSVQLEADPVLRRLSDVSPLAEATLTGWTGAMAGREVVVLAAGMGKVNAARALTALAERRSLAGVIGFGVAGAYPGSGLSPGDVALAGSEHYGDEGVDTPHGWIGCDEIGIPLLEHEGIRYFNQIPIDRDCLSAAMTALNGAGRAVRVGPFVTVSTCSGTTSRGMVLATRYEALCETMEGAALAHVAATYGVGFLEVRGISNLVEDRDPSRWKLPEAASAVAEALPSIVAAWPRERSPMNNPSP